MGAEGLDGEYVKLPTKRAIGEKYGLKLSASGAVGCSGQHEGLSLLFACLLQECAALQRLLQGKL